MRTLSDWFKKQYGTESGRLLLCFLGMCLVFVYVILNAFVTTNSALPDIPETITPWNMRELIEAGNQVREEAESIYVVKRMLASEADLPKGLKISSANIQDDDVLVVFNRYRDLNPSFDRDYIAVYDVYGNWQYGVEGIFSSSTLVALMPDSDGLLFRKWRNNSTGDDLYLLLLPDGLKTGLVEAVYWGSDGLDTPVFWKSEYQVLSTDGSRLVIRHAATGEECVVFDYSDAYPEMYPHSSKIEEEHEHMLNALVPVFFMLVMILVLPKMMDNPDIPKRGMKESHGDLRNRWR